MRARRTCTQNMCAGFTAGHRKSSRRTAMTTFNSRNRLLARAGVSVAFALCTCLVAHGASAAQLKVKTTAVSFADLDLSKAAGAQTLYKRIKVAARRVCGPADR